MDNVKEMTQELKEGQQSGVQRISKKRLIDSLNNVSFQKNSIIINLEHIQYQNVVSLRAYPQPCSGLTLHCLWAEPCPPNITTSFALKNFMIDRGLDLIVAEAQIAEVTGDGITFVLPDACRSLRTREARRYSAKEVQVTLLQESIAVSGTLEDFTATSFRVLVKSKADQVDGWISEGALIYAMFMNGQSVIYTGECKLIRQLESKHGPTLVFEHLYSQNVGISQRRIKSEGYSLLPQPGIAFIHPLSQKRINLKTDEISSCWFSVTEYYDSTVLFSGLVIPEVEIEIAPGFSVTCKARVSHGALCKDEESRTVKWSILILDMNIEDQGRLFSLLQGTKHQASRPCSKVDLDDLFTFFFDTGLVYAQKYAGMHFDEQAIKNTYKKLYFDNPTIARHFMQIDRGVIQGHLSMIRFYKNTWTIHHHAANGQNAAGLSVLNQVRDYVHDYRHMPSSHMDFLVCYFRPNNKFPYRVFGRFSLFLNNPSICSTDSFAYLNFSFKSNSVGPDENRWKIEASTTDDLSELASFYDYLSGGLLIKALDLGPDQDDTNNLNDEYKKLGLKREKYVYSFKNGGELKAIILVLVSDPGVNLSGLTNCLHVFVLDSEELSPDVLYRHIAKLSPHYVEDEIPMLLYPISYADNQGIPYDKEYQLWAFDTRYTEKFYEFMKSIMSRRNGVDKAEDQVR